MMLFVKELFTSYDQFSVDCLHVVSILYILFFIYLVLPISSFYVDWVGGISLKQP